MLMVIMMMMTRIIGSKQRRERQKDNRFRLAKQQLCAFSTLFLHISLPTLHDHDMNIPNFTFCGGRDHNTTTFFFFSWTSKQSFRIQFQNMANIWRFDRDVIGAKKVGSSANSLLKWRFRSRRRRCCLSSLMTMTLTITTCKLPNSPLCCSLYLILSYLVMLHLG